MLIRQNAPVFGASGFATPQPGEWQISLGFRTLRADDHYRLGEEEPHRHELGTFVINRQRALDVTLAYQATPRTSVSLGVPFVDASWSIPRPTQPIPGPRSEQHASGLGDITLSGRYLLFDPLTRTRGNVGVGLGVKFPTGNDEAQDTFVDRDLEVRRTTVDQSIQPGDGGWGLTLEGQGYLRAGPATLFASANYLVNPRNTNHAQNGREEPLHVNSVPDQYLVRAGAAVPTGITGLSASLAWRAEGMPRYDLIGRSDGFRRPGYSFFIEPGLFFSRGPSAFGIYVPITYHRMRLANPYTGTLGDATFPDAIMLVTYSYRFGGRESTPAPPTALPTLEELRSPDATLEDRPSSEDDPGSCSSSDLVIP